MIWLQVKTINSKRLDQHFCLFHVLKYLFDEKVTTEGAIFEIYCLIRATCDPLL
jgi:hypothetical protein